LSKSRQAAPESKPLTRKGKYPFGELAIGESFVTNRSQPQISALAIEYSKRHGATFKTKKMADGVRVTRTA
jgi:hypothetical protein